jgi:hypothetical protein
VNDGDAAQDGSGSVVGIPFDVAGLQWTQPGQDMLREILTDLMQLD